MYVAGAAGAGTPVPHAKPGEEAASPRPSSDAEDEEDVFKKGTNK